MSSGEAVDLRLLRQVLMCYLLSDAWADLRERVISRVRKCGAKWKDKLVSKQMFYHVIGPELRRRLNVASDFEPTLLIEPYVMRKERVILSSRIGKYLMTSLLEELAVPASTDGQEIVSLFRASDAYLERVCAGFAHHYKTEWCRNAFEYSDLLGCALVRLLHRNTYATLTSLLRLRDDGDALVSPESSSSRGGESACDGAAADNPLLSAILVNFTSSHHVSSLMESHFVDSAAQTDPLLESYRLTQEREGANSLISKEGMLDHNSNGGVYSLGLTDRAQYVRLFQQLSGQADDVGMAMLWFQPSAVSSLCAGLLGSLLSDRLRRCLWAYRLCVPPRLSLPEGSQPFSAHGSEQPHIAPFRYVADLTRMSSLKNVSYLKSTPILNATRRYLHGLAPRAFPLLYSIIAASAASSASMSSATGRGSGAAAAQRDSSSDPSGYAILDSGPMAVLLKRAEALVSALYVLHGVISDRTVMLSLLLVRLLCCDVHIVNASAGASPATVEVVITSTTVPPVSELVLAVYHRLLGAWLPTDSPEAEFNYVSTNAAVWEILGKEDPSLLEHLRAHLASDPYLDPNEALRRRHAATARNNAFSSMRSDSGGIQEFTIESESMRNDARYGGAMEAALRRPRDMPWGLHLIKGWMDTGFLGWLPEHGVMFVFDQMAMLDSYGGGDAGAPENKDVEYHYHVHKRFFVRLCVQLLKMHRSSLMATREDFVSALRASCLKTPSKAVFAAACECLVLIPKDETVEEATRRRCYKAAVLIQRCTRGRIARLRMTRMRDERRRRLMREEGGGAHHHHSEPHVWMQRLTMDNLTLPPGLLPGDQASPSRHPRSRHGLDDRRLRIPSGLSEMRVDVYDDPSGHMLHDIYSAPIAQPSEEHFARAHEMFHPSHRSLSEPESPLHFLGPYILAPSYTDIVNKINDLSGSGDNRAGASDASYSLNGKQRLDVAHAILLDVESRESSSRITALDEDSSHFTLMNGVQSSTETTRSATSSMVPPQTAVSTPAPMPGGRARAALRSALAVTRMQSRGSVATSNSDSNNDGGNDSGAASTEGD